MLGLEEAGYSPTTIRDAFHVTTTVPDYGIRHGHPSSNPIMSDAQVWSRLLVRSMSCHCRPLSSPERRPAKIAVAEIVRCRSSVR